MTLKQRKEQWLFHYERVNQQRIKSGTIASN